MKEVNSTSLNGIIIICSLTILTINVKRPEIQH